MNIKEIKNATKTYPKFDDGRIDYSKERICFVLNCVVVSGDMVLLTRRGADVIAYPNMINGISGFIDRTDLSIEDLARDELADELNAPLTKIKRFVPSTPFVQVDDSINREWHVVAILVEFVETFAPKLNWENKSAQWYKIEEARKLDLMPGFRETLETALKLRDF